MKTLTEDDQRAQGGGVYDDGKPEWRTNLAPTEDDEIADLERSFNDSADTSDLDDLPTAEYPEGHPSSSKNKSKRGSDALDGDGIDEKEKKGAGDGSAENGKLPGESRFYNEGFAAGKAFAAAGGASGGLGAVMAVFRTRKSQAAGLGGIIVTIFLLGMAFFTTGLELVHFSDNFKNRGMLHQTYSMKSRRLKTALYMLGTYIGKANADADQAALANFLKNSSALHSEEAIASLRAGGATIEQGAGGEIAKFTVPDLGNGTQTLDYAAARTAGDLDKRLVAFADATGPAELKDFLNTHLSETAAGELGGPLAEAGAAKTLLSSFRDWLNNVTGDPKNPENDPFKVAEAAEAPEANIDIQTGAGAVEGSTTSETTDPATGKPAQGTVTNNADSLNTAATDAADSNLNNVLHDAESIAQASAGDEAKIITQVAERSGIAVGRTAEAAALSTIDYSQDAQLICKTVGLLDYVASVRNILFSVELARFALRYLNAADSQKAGLLAGEGLSLYFEYLRLGASSGSSYNSAPGLLYAVGDHSQTVSAASLAQFSTGRTNAGIFGVISDFIHRIPLVNGNQRGALCKTVSNGWFQAGSLVVGAVVAVVSFDSIGAFIASAELPATAVLAGAYNIVVDIAAPMLARTGKHLVMAKLSGSDIGDGLGAGLGALGAMTSNQNAMLITSKQDSAMLRLAALNDLKHSQAKLSFKDRYFSLKNSESLVSRIAMATAGKFTPQTLARANPGSLLQAHTIADLVGNSAYAASYSTQCGDKALEPYATDPFCNPEISIAPDLDINETYNLLLQNNQIQRDGSAVPGSKFESFVKNCASYNPSVVYNNDVKKDGSTVKITIDDCTSDAVALNGETTPASKAYAYIYNNLPKPSLFARLLGQRAYAASAQSGLVSQRMRFAAWQAYGVDVKTIGDEYSAVEDDTPVAATTPTSTPGSSSPADCPTGPVTDQSQLVPIYNQVDGSVKFVHRCIGELVNSMIAAAKAKNFIITVNSGWRSYDQQVALRRDHCGTTNYDIYQKPSRQCNPPTATPGNSNHEGGVAVDLACNGSLISSHNACWSWIDTYWQGFPNNARLYNLPSEAWHWSINGK